MHVVIIGNGITGVTAALRVRRRRPDWRITMVSGESTHPWSRPALMYVYMGHMRYQDTKPYPDALWSDKRIELKRAWITSIDPEAKRLELHGDEPLSYDRLLIATGSKPNRFDWEGQDLAGVQGLYGLMDLRLLYENSKNCRHAVIVGGGLIGVELAEMLRSRGIGVTMLVRERSYWANVLPAEESAMVGEVIAGHGIEVLYETELARVLDDGSGRCCGVVTTDGREIPCQLVGLTAGVSPNLDIVAETAIDTAKGVLVNQRLETSVSDVWAAGDCAEIDFGDAEETTLQQVWYTGKMQGEIAGDNIAAERGEERAYRPSIWFNSAKFIDLEYQVYGQVDADVAGRKSLFWRHPDNMQSVRLTYTEQGLIGVQTMGIRYRHEVCEGWIEQSLPINRVLERLDDANFDPEFAARRENAVRRRMKEQMA